MAARSKAIAANKETCGAFEPCLWGDFFVTYTPTPSKARIYLSLPTIVDIVYIKNIYRSV